ncbi:DEAD/DEAH box helicase [Metabacillus sp. HB246100]
MNEILANHYNNAIERTKSSVLADMFKYFEKQEELPTYEEYIRERGVFINQLWLNSWLNTVGSHASNNEKRDYLTQLGFELEGLSKKTVNQMFRNEIRDVEPFHVIEWLNSLYIGQEQIWKQKYEEARQGYKERVRLLEEREKRKKFILKLEYYIDQLFGDHYEELYLYVRYLIGSQLAIDIEQKGIILDTDYCSFQEFIEVEGEAVYNRHQYEDVTEKYEGYISNYLLDFGPNWLMEHLSPHIFDDYYQAFQETLPISLIKEIAYDPFLGLCGEFFEDLLEEYVTDLTKLIDIPFDLEVHLEIFEKDLALRERRATEELEALKRRKEEEARMIEDIFGREYSPSKARSIQYILHVGETNTGKTFQAIEKMKQANSGIYLAPLRLLALEIYERLNEEGIPCSLKTGEEEKIVEGAQHISCTVEMFREKDSYEVVVIDESQMIADKDRGFSWYKAMTKANAKEVHIICSFNAQPMILELLGDTNIEIHEYYRDIPLEVEPNFFRLNQTKKGDALVCFSRKRVLETASELQRTGRQVSMIYGSMPPETRKKQMQRFINGETTVIVATDAIGMGLNLPIRRIVFLENDKFDGTRRRYLRSQEVKQIAGRAGRRGIYNIGKVAFTHNVKTMTRLLEQEDEPLHGFAIAPTPSILERFQKYSRKLGLFFYLWDLFKSPHGTKKASLAEEKLLYEMVEDTMIEAKLSVPDLYGFLHLPFSSNEPTLRNQWKMKLEAIIDGNELPDPVIKEGTLEELELSYKSIGLHLLFLYKLGRNTEAHYWERIRENLSDSIHEKLKSGVQIAKKACKNCGKSLHPSFKFTVCNDCYFERQDRRKVQPR